MYCPRCGSKIEEGARFCTVCGQSAISPPPFPTASSSVMPGEVNAPQQYAGFWVRAAAYSIDSLILDVPLYAVMLLGIFSRGGFRRLAPIAGSGAVASSGPFAPNDVLPGFFVGRLLFVMLIFFVANWLYFAAMESSVRQATLGKSAMSLRVADVKGQRLSFAHASGRFFAKIVSSIVPLGLGYILAGFTTRKQALHDMIAGTLVLRK